MGHLNVFTLVSAYLLAFVSCASHSSWPHSSSGNLNDLSSILNYIHHQDNAFNTHNTHVDDGCDHPKNRDHLIQLLSDWYFHHDTAAIKQFYYDMVLIDMAASSVNLPHTRKARGLFDSFQQTHNEAYTNHDTVPDVKHLEDIARNQMNSACRQYVLQTLEKLLHHSSVAPGVTTTISTASTHPPTHAPHHTHQQTRRTTTTTWAPPHVHYTHRPLHAHHTQVPTTTTTKPVVTTTSSALAKTHIITNSLAGICKDGTHTESEALVLASCNVPPPTSWTQGINVMQNCKSIPRYTPVATFLLGNYVIDGTAMSGVFVECTPTGFKFGAQLCGHTPQIYELTSGDNQIRQNADEYFVVN